jgi:dTDP-4-amino-4,6-dideoxygalactose transaminase
MNEFTGAVALAQLRKLDRTVLDVTRRHHHTLREHLAAACPDLRLRWTSDADGDAGIAFFMDLGTPQNASRFAEALRAEGIRVGPSSGCSNLLHSELIQGRRMPHPALPPFGPGWPGEHVQFTPDLCPNTDTISQSMTCVALCPAMTDDDVVDVENAIVKVWRAIGQVNVECATSAQTL